MFYDQPIFSLTTTKLLEKNLGSTKLQLWAWLMWWTHVQSKMQALKLFLPSLFLPALQPPTIASALQSYKGLWEEVASNCTAEGKLPDGEKKRAQVPCCQQKAPINKAQHIKPLLLICCLDLKRLLFSLSSKLQLLTLFLSLCLCWTQAILLSWRFVGWITCHPGCGSSWVQTWSHDPSHSSTVKWMENLTTPDPQGRKCRESTFFWFKSKMMFSTEIGADSPFVNCGWNPGSYLKES